MALTGDGARVERERLEAAVSSSREELTRTLGELRGVMRERLDWRAWVARRPLWAVAAAALVGFTLATRGRR